MGTKSVFKISHPGVMLKRTLEELGISQYRFARKSTFFRSRFFVFVRGFLL